MSETAGSPPKGSGGVGSKTGAVVIAAAAVAIVFILIMAFMLSPSMSPLASVHDADGDGYPDSVDEFQDDESEWTDLDGDGVGDNSDDFPDDATETLDSDSDGVGDNSDEFPDDEDECSDTDDDGTGDNADLFPEDDDEWDDTDSDGVGDNSDEFPEDDTEWSDTDGDGVGDNTDAFPEDPAEDSPEVRFDADIMNDGVSFVFTAVSPEFEWDDLTVTLSSGSDTAVWETEDEDLDGWEPFTAYVYGSFDIEGTDISLTALDLTGDGMVSVFDGLGIYPEGGSFEPGVVYAFTITYEPTGHDFESGSFSFDTTTPVTTLTDQTITDGVQIVFGAIDDDIAWEKVSFLLSDGTNTGFWSNVTGDMLDDGFGDTQVMQTVTLGSLVVSFSIMDISGNGEINQGDYIRLTATSFAVDTDYTFVAIFEPTDGLMAECTFSG